MDSDHTAPDASMVSAYRRAEEAWADALYRGDDRARDKYKREMERIQTDIYNLSRKPPFPAGRENEQPITRRREQDAK